MGSDFQRTILWVILAASVFMLWDNWQVYNGKPSFPVRLHFLQDIAITDSLNNKRSVPLLLKPLNANINRVIIGIEIVRILPFSVKTAVEQDNNK